MGHLITVIIGAGVLSLPKAFSLLGWIFGPILLIFFGIVSLWTSKMLTQVYEVDGKKNKTYKDAVFNILGAGHRNTLATILYVKMYVSFNMLDIIASILNSSESLYAAAHMIIPTSFLNIICLRFMNAINYTISGATSMQFIANTACKWQGSTGCMSGIWAMTGIFSCLQLILNVLPNLESIWQVNQIIPAR